jgi:hypothetical protein
MDNNKIMDYLYGEMSEEEKSQFEIKMREDDALKREVESINEVRSFLQEHKDEPLPSTTTIVEKPARIYHFSKWWAIAASLLLLLIAGKVLDFRVKTGDGQLVMGFGPIEENAVIEPIQPGFTAEQLEGILVSFKDEIRSELDKQAELMVQSDQKISDQRDEMNRWMNQVQLDQSQLAEALWNAYDSDKNLFTTRLVNDFIKYNETQRQEDLEMINKGFSDLARMIKMNIDPAAHLVYQPTQK